MVQPANPRPPAPKKPKGSRRMTRELIALGSAAVLAVYAVGYHQTDSAAQQLAAQQASVSAGRAVAPTATTAPLPTVVPPVVPPAPTATAADSPTPMGPASSASSAIASPTATTAVPTATGVPPTATTAPPPPTVAAVSKYKDGTFTGYGSGRHGSIQVALVIKGGKIASANISRCGTRYPCSDIADLPGAVISAQSTNVDTISGATDSSDSYLEAVDQALLRASGQA